MTEDDNPEEEEQGAQPAPTGEEQARPDKTDADSDQDQRPPDDSQAQSDVGCVERALASAKARKVEIEIFCTVAMAAFTFVLTIATVAQNCSTQKALRESERANKIAREAFEATSAAILVPSLDWPPQEPLLPDKTATAWITIQNVGRMSATRLQTHYEHEMVVPHKRPKFELPPLNDSETVIMPGSSQQYPIWVSSLSQANIDKMNRTEILLHMYGVIRYFDGFHDRCQEFCFIAGTGGYTGCRYSPNQCQ